MPHFLEWFRNAAERFADKTALEWDGQATSYAALDGWSDAVAARLRSMGVAGGDIVPVLLPRSDAALAAIIGVLKTGAAYSCLDIAYPKDRVDFVVRDTGARTVVDAAFMDNLGAVAGPWDPVAPKPGDPAVVVYTSGSTGNPKGVVNSWRAFTMALNASRLGQTEADVFLGTMPFSFVAAVCDSLFPLAIGGTLHIADDVARRDPVKLAEYCRENGVTVAVMSPQLLSGAIRGLEGQVRLALTGSEKVSRIYSDTVRIINVYGASETCGPVTHFVIDQPYDTTPIGTPGPGSTVYILDDAGNRLPAGETGEICISGQVASGYLNLPELTAKAFTVNPWATGKEDAVLYRTGDLGRMRKDGVVEYVQRKDWMIKVRGFRVEPGEIEAAIVNRGGAARAAVVGFDNAAGQTSLYAVYTADRPLPPEEVAEAIRAFLPDYMMPAFMEQLDALPLNPNGKVDRKRLAPPDAARFLKDYEAPEGEAETLLCRTFAEVLGLEKVGAADDFTALGGDSIAAVRLQTALPEYALSPADILRLRTPRALAKVMARRQALPKAAERADWPLTFSERQMAAEQGLDPASVAYNVGIAFDLRGRVDVQKLEDSFNKLIARHRILRSFYALENGEFVHRIKPELKITVAVERSAPARIESRVKELNTPFDLAKAPLLRVTLLETGEDEAVLYLNMHHIIVDGMSGGLLVDELWKTYRGESLPPVERDYLDWAAWQEKNPPSDDAERFFLDMFADGLPENEMPTKPVRPEVLPYVDSTERAGTDARKVKAEALRLGITEYSLLAGAVGMALAKYCNSEDVVLGIAVNGRSLPETGAMQGMFVNNLPLRLKPAGAMAAGEYLRATADLVEQVKARQDYPFERLVPRLAPVRNPSRGPIFDMQFNYLHQLPAFRAGGLEAARRPMAGQALAADLMLEIINEGDSLQFALSYSRRLYEPEVAKNMLEQLVVTLGRLCEGDGGQSVMDAAELPETQRRQILVDFAGPVNNDGVGRTVVDLFRERAKAEPDRPAIRSGDIVLSYGEMDAATDSLAAELRRRGAGRGGCVAVLTNRNQGFVVGALGVLKSGAAYLPLDPSYPAERLEFMLEDAGAAIVVGDDVLKDRIPGFGGEWLSTGDIYDLPAGKPEGKPAGDDLFVLIYTSGTTGKPKGVMIDHANVADLCAWCRRAFRMTADDGCSVYASFGFDASVIDIFPALTCGAQLHMISEEMRLDLPGLNDYYNRHHVTLTTITTQLGRQFVESMDNHSLRALSVGGEALVPVQPPKNYTFYNQYGPTEFTVSASMFEVDGIHDRIPIGKPNDNSRLYIVDRNGRLAPVGAAGELYLSGRGVAQGYLNRPELTAEKFVANPFSSDPGYERAYRTGDVARFLPSGDVDFMGRSDFQVKIRGFRVELTEIEARVRAFPAVRDAAVVALEAPGGGKCAVAYVVADGRLDVAELDRFIGEELPPYMVPAAVVELDAIPLNPNGKVDRRKLPPPTFAAPREGGQAARPRTELEEGIAEVVKEVLGHGDFDVDANLLQSGLASLSAIKLSTLLLKRYGVAVPVKDLMAAPTIVAIENGIVRALLNRAEEEPSAALLPRRDGEREDYPLTPAQEQMYVLRLTLDNPTTYNIPSTYLLPDDVDENRLLRALEEVVRRHAGLRAYFVDTDGGPRQRVADEFNLEVLWGEATRDGAGAAIASWIRPFDLAKPPLLRCGLLRLREGGTVFFLDMHHIIADGVSIGVMLEEVARLYAGVTLPPPDADYLDYALWRERNLGPDAMREHKDYWLDLLEGELPYSEIIPDFERPAVMDQTGRAVSRQVPARTVEALRRLANRHETSLFTVMLAGWGLLLSRYTGVEDVVFGVPFSGRGRPGLDAVVGMFVSTQAVRLKPDLDMTVDDYLRGVAELARDAQLHQDAPVADIIAALGIPRDASRNPLYSAVFNFFSLGAMPEGLSLKPVDFGGRIAHFDLDIEAREEGGVINLDAVYAAKLYRPESMEALLDRFVRLLEALPGRAGAALGDLDVAGEDERRALNDGGAFQALDWNRDIGYDALFREQAARTPDKVALVCKDVRLTYREVDAASDRVAAFLMNAGVGPEKIVALLCERSERFTLAALGVIKAGGAYMPMDHNTPPERVRYMLEDAGAVAVVADEALRHLAAEAGVPVYSAAELTRPGPAVAPPRHQAKPGDAFIVLYTSGSTGNPKGAVLEHRSLVAFCRMHAHRSALTENDVSAMYASFAFDASMMDAYPFLAVGGAVHVIPEEMRLNLPALYEYFEQNGVTCAFMTTQLGKQFIDNYQPSALRHFDLGGEKLGVWTRDDRTFHNIYGPTECTIYTNGHRMTGPELRAPIGAAAANIREYVLDRSGRALPDGMPGELGIAGPQVMRGYIGRPDLNAEKLLPNTFCPDPDYALIYRTGDVVRRLANGEVDYLDRIDRQVKIRGYRIELGEVELRLRELGLFSSMAVVDLEDPAGGKYLCCYYTADNPVDVNAAKAALGETMPAYMIPSVFMALDAIPLNQNGKVNRSALPKPDMAGAGAEYAPPANDAESALCDVWAAVLGTQPIGVDDNFFEIGGTSIKAVGLQVRIRKELGVNLPVNLIMQNPTVRDMARLLVASEAEPPAPPAVAKAGEREYYPLTPPQQQMYILWQTLECKTAYNIPAAYRLEGPLDTAALSEAADALIARHAALRTGFKEIDREVVQFVLPPDKVRCKKMFKTAKESEVKDILAEWIAPFNLARPPLLRLGLIQIAPQTHVMLLDTHHIVADGLSMPTLTRDLLALYRGEKLDPPALDYTDYAVWFEKNVAGKDPERQEKFWEKQFADGVPRLDLPLDFPRPAVQQTAGAALHHTLSEALQADLRRLATRHKTTPYAVLLAAWAATLARSAGAREVVVGVPHSGRILPETETMPGMFVNTLPMLIRPGGDVGFAELVDQVVALEQSVQDKQNLSLPTLIDALNLPRELSHNPLYDVSFNYLEDPGSVRIGDLTLSGYDQEIDSIHFDLTLTVVASDSAIRLNLIYATALFGEESALNLLGRLLRVLEEAVRDETRPLHAIDLLGPDERRRLLEDFNANRFQASGRTLCDLVDAHGRERPQAPAVHDVHGGYTFGELYRRSNALAARIHAAAGTEAYVAVMLPRIRDIYVAELAVMKAGCAFLPIDPDYPDARVDVMLKDSGAKLLLTVPELAERAGGFGVPVLDATDDELSAGDAVFNSLARPDGIAYLIYTSGSTGTPKGVMVRHDGFANIMEYFGRAFSLDAAAVAAAYASFSFDVSLIDSWPFLAAGGQVHVIPSDIRLDLDGLAEFLRRNQVTDLHLPTQFGEQFVEEFESPFMKRVLIGGEKMRRRFDKSFAVYNSYGPTETSIDTNFMLVDRDYANIPIGKPAGNVFEYVLDEFGGLVPVGVPGELCISGVQTAAGYLNRPELTAEKFAPNPYAFDRHTQVMYRTGDLARWNANGEIEHLGRIDRQVKINGYRIELGEIELALAALPGVEECTVVDAPDASGGKYLCAYYVGSAADAAELRQGLGGSLPKYMVPDIFVKLDAMPLTQSGKVDRHRLPRPERREARREATPPATASERKIFEVWQQVLGHGDFGVDDAFFDIGGNSLKAIRAVSLLKNIFDIDINRMYQYPTIRQLAANSGEARFDLRTALRLAKQHLSQPKAPPADAVPPETWAGYDAYVAEAAGLDLSEAIAGEEVLLCGATGYLGAFLLNQLLRKTTRRIHTLVRGATREEAAERLLGKMRYYFGDGFAFPEDRVTVWRGDLSAERFGLSEAEYAILAEDVAAIVNAAANVRHYGRYEEFYHSNVRTVLNLVEFAKTGTPKRLCHVSTMSVANGLVEGREAVAFSELDVDLGQKVDNVYVRTKLEAEVEVMKAAKAGLDAQIFRVGNITPDSRRGTVQENIEENGFFGTVKAMINLGMLPKRMACREFSHVDRIAEAIRLLFDRKALGGQIFHIHNPDLVDMAALFTRENLNLRLEVVEDAEFLDRLSDRIDLETTRDLIETFLLHTGLLDTQSGTTRFMVRSDRTQALLKRLDFVWGDMHVSMIAPMARKALEERAAFLAGTGLFEGISEREAAVYAGLARMEVYGPDSVIEERDVHEVGLLENGLLEKSLVSRQGWQGTVRLVSAGEVFAQSSLAGKESAGLYEPAFGEAQVLWFDREAMAAILQRNPKASLAMIGDLAKDLEAFQRMWVNMG